MNVCLLTSVAGNGGSASTAFHTARVLRQSGWKTTLFAPGEYWAERGQREGVTVRSLELRRGFHPLSFRRDFAAFRRYVREENVDAVLVQKSPEQWLAGLVLSSLRRPVALVRLRGVVFAIRPSLVNRWLHNRMELVVCSASVIARQYETLPGFAMQNVKVLLEGADARRFAPATPEQRAAARTKFRLDPDAFYIGTAGRPSPVKGHDVLVRAFAQACAGKPGVRLCVFADESRRGPGSYASLCDLCTELGIREQTDLVPGFIDDMTQVYHALDVYALPSRGSEGSSRAGLEASASGLPVVASSVGVLPDLIQDGVTGRLVPPDDPAALAAVLREWVEDRTAPRTFGSAARERIVRELTEDHYSQRLAALLTQAVQDARQKRGLS